MFAGPVLSCFSQGRSNFPSEEILARIGFLALTDNLISGSTLPARRLYALLETKTSHPLNYLFNFHLA